MAWHLLHYERCDWTQVARLLMLFHGLRETERRGESRAPSCVSGSRSLAELCLLTSERACDFKLTVTTLFFHEGGSLSVYLL